MLSPLHAEVLARDWLPPVVLGRESEVAEVVRRLDPPSPHAPPPWMVAVAGPPGAGTSVVARRAAREVADRVRVARAGAVPRFLAVRTAHCRGTHGVVTALLSALDDGFDGRGFPVAEILAGFLRRVRREGRPLVLVLDDVTTGGPELGPVLRGLGDPDRFLPEGEFGLPPTWTVLAGGRDALIRAEAGVRDRWRLGPFVELSACAPRSLRQIAEDRAGRALGGAPPPGFVDGLLERVVADGGGASRLLELLRRSLLGPSHRTAGPLGRIASRDAAIPLEATVLRALEEAARGNAAVVGDVRRCEARAARALGVSPLPPTTLWRRIVRLEQAGYVRREVRPGGVGGTRSVVRLMAPIDEWVTQPSPRGTRPGFDAWASAAPPRELAPDAAPEGPRPVAGPG